MVWQEVVKDEVALIPLPQQPNKPLEGLPLRRWLNHGPPSCLGGHSDSDLDDVRRR